MVPGRTGHGRSGLRIPIAALLLAGLGGLVFVAVAAVLVLGLLAGERNTRDLLQDKAVSVVDSVVQRVRAELDPVAAQVSFLAAQVAEDPALPAARSAMMDLMHASMAGVPQVRGTAFIDSAGYVLGVDRDGQRADRVLSGEGGWPDLVAQLGQVPGGNWGPPVWDEGMRETLLNRRMPVMADGEIVGIVVAVVTVPSFSTYVEGTGLPGGRAFVLYGADRVLAHPTLVRSRLGSAAAPLPALDGVGDRVLAAIWAEEGDRVDVLSPLAGLDARYVQLDGRGGPAYVFLYRTLDGFGPEPWTVGAYLSMDVAGGEIRRLAVAGFAGVGILLVALAAAALLARLIGPPARGLAQAAQAAETLDFASIAPARGSMVRELDDAARAFNRMVAGLRWFETYVPRALVLRLLRQAGTGEIRSEERVVSVLFTDIRNFTALAHRLGTVETAALLNAHFTLVNRCIEAESGTVDKYIGDSVMGFWGAPEAQPDHAARACRAAIAIAEAVVADNARRQAEGAAPIGLRIGVFSGPVIVGNIGSPGRINYTLVGDAVNVAQRLEALGKVVAPEAEICVLVGDDTRILAPDFPSRPAGEHDLRGRAEPVGVYRLV